MEEKELLINNSLDKKNSKLSQDNNYPFNDVKYICDSTDLIVKSIQQGFDITQLPNGDITICEVKAVNVHYSWDSVKQKFIKTGQS